MSLAVDWSKAEVRGTQAPGSARGGDAPAPAAPCGCGQVGTGQPGEVAPVVQASSAWDLPLTLPTGRKCATLRQFMAVRRAQGRQPHPFGEDWDALVVGMLAGAARGESLVQVGQR